MNPYYGVYGTLQNFLNTISGFPYDKNDSRIVWLAMTLLSGLITLNIWTIWGKLPETPVWFYIGLLLIINAIIFLPKQRYLKIANKVKDSRYKAHYQVFTLLYTIISIGLFVFRNNF